MKVWGSCLVHLCFKLGVWGYLGCKLGRSWSQFGLQIGGYLAHFASKLGALGVILAPVGGSGGLVGPSWLQVGGHGSILAVLVPSWPSCWGVLGSFWFQVGGSWLQVEGLGGHLRVMLGVCWGYVGASWSSFAASYINLCCKSFDFEKVPKV